MQKEKWSSRAFGAALYIIPIVFLIVTYVFMTVAAEDIYQGAGTGSGFFQAAVDAFHYDSRISDMYAWTVIRAFDYQFSFGIDTIFRLINVLLSFGIIYMITALILGRRPGLRLGDGAVFATVFFLIFANNKYESLYLAFSNVHNYLTIGFITLLFLLPFGFSLLGRKLPGGVWFRGVMLICGFLFGMSCNLTPLAFVAVLLLMWFFGAVKERKFDLRKILCSWEFAALIGIGLACFVMYGLGNGLSAYTGSDDYVMVNDYIAISDIFAQPGKSMIRIMSHIVDNFRIMAPSFISMALALFFELAAGKKKGSYGGAKLVGSCLLFVVMHTLAMTQILVQPSMRLIMPAYFVTLAAVGYGAFHMLQMAKISAKSFAVYGVIIALLSATAVVDMADFRIRHNRSAAEVLETIQTAEGDVVYISRAALEVEESKIFGYTQYPLLMDWILFQPVCGKYIYLTD